jgi:hypothetical protein
MENLLSGILKNHVWLILATFLGIIVVFLFVCLFTMEVSIEPITSYKLPKSITIRSNLVTYS